MKWTMAQKKAKALPGTNRKTVYESCGPILKYFGSKMPKSTISRGSIY